MNSVLKKLEIRRILVSDGAWGTFLHEMGLVPGECPEEWSISHPAQVLRIAKSYVDAGADMIETNSFGANRLKLQHFGLQDKASEINERAAAISRAAAGNKASVIASIGPTGKMLLMGDITEEELYEAFKEQAVALERGGADAVCIETFTALDEASLAVRAARDNTSLEVICTFTFDKTLQGTYRSMMGVSPSEVVSTILPVGAHIIGTNCGNGMLNMADIVKEMHDASPETPILVHANAGAPVIKNGKTVFPETAAQMRANAARVLDAGASIIGGCCGTTPEHISALRALVDSRL